MRSAIAISLTSAATQAYGGAAEQLLGREGRPWLTRRPTFLDSTLLMKHDGEPLAECHGCSGCRGSAAVTGRRLEQSPICEVHPLKTASGPSQKCFFELGDGSRVEITADKIQARLSIDDVHIQEDGASTCESLITKSIITTEAEMGFRAESIVVNRYSAITEADCNCYTQAAFDLGFKKVDIAPTNPMSLMRWPEYDEYGRVPMVNCNAYSEEGASPFAFTAFWTFFDRQKREQLHAASRGGDCAKSLATPQSPETGVVAVTMVAAGGVAVFAFAVLRTLRLVRVRRRASPVSKVPLLAA